MWPGRAAPVLRLEPYLRLERLLPLELEPEVLVGSVAQEFRRLVERLEAFPPPPVVRVGPPLRPLLEEPDLKVRRTDVEDLFISAGVAVPFISTSMSCASLGVRARRSSCRRDYARCPQDDADRRPSLLAPRAALTEESLTGHRLFLEAPFDGI